MEKGTITPITWVDLLVTERCNFNCTYCFHQQEPKDMSYEVLEDTFELIKPLASETCIFNYFGGEPTLRVDFLRESARRIRKIYPKSKFHISTNLSLVSDDFLDFAKEYFGFCSLQVSYDGVDQDKNRGSSALVRENIRKCIDSLGAKILTARLTYTKETVGNLYKSMVDAYELGFPNFMHSPDYLPGWDEEHYKVYRGELDKMYDFIKIHPEFTVRFADCNLAIKISKEAKCGMGTALIAVSADGRIFPCHRAVAHPELCIGDVTKKYLNRGMFLSLKCEKCDNCESRNACHNCLVASYKYMKSLREPLECVCGINKIEYNKAKEVYREIHADEILTDNVFTNILVVLNDISTVNKKTISMFRGE